MMTVGHYLPILHQCGQDRPVSDVYADFNRTSAPTITAIRREQMPEQVRSAFCPEDIILFHQPRHQNSDTTTVHSQASDLPKPRCLRRKAIIVCTGLIVVLTALVWLGAACMQDKETFAFRVSKITMILLSVSSLILALVLVYIQWGAEAYDRTGLSCTLSSSSLILLQQPMVNVRSFFRYYQFFSKGKAGGPSDEEVDSCIRHLADDESAISLAELIGDGSHALLGLEPCQDLFTGFTWGFSWLNVLYQSYRDWKRWRLAALACERLQVQTGAFLQQSRMEGPNPLEGLGGRGGHKWLLVDPKLFPSNLPSQPRAS